MTYSVYQHWDPLKVCAVGRSYPPEFYSWIKVPHVRELFERIAQETEEDYQKIIKKLNEFGVQVIRTQIPKTVFLDGQFREPPMNPRDYMVMIGETFYENCSFDFKDFYNSIKANSWPDCQSLEEFYLLPNSIINEANEVYHLNDYRDYLSAYDNIINHVKSQGNIVKSKVNGVINGAMVSRVGKDLYFGTIDYKGDFTQVEPTVKQEFFDYRSHVVNTGGHADGSFCPVTPGLIISINDIPTYKDTFPGWEVVYLPNQSWDAIVPFHDLKKKNNGRWWIPGFEHDQDVVDTVETWLGHWTGYVEETVFDVNMLIIDPKNVMVFSYNKQVFDALERYGITPHIVPFRHRYFWDGGIHCVTLDLQREGTMKDYFPERG